MPPAGAKRTSNTGVSYEVAHRQPFDPQHAEPGGRAEPSAPHVMVLDTGGHTVALQRQGKAPNNRARYRVREGLQGPAARRRIVGAYHPREWGDRAVHSASATKGQWALA